MRRTHCLKMSFGINLELHLSALLIYLIFQSFSHVNASVGRCQSHLWPTSPFTIITLFILFPFSCADFIICCRILILINLVWFFSTQNTETSYIIMNRSWRSKMHIFFVLEKRALWTTVTTSCHLVSILR